MDCTEWWKSLEGKRWAKGSMAEIVCESFVHLAWNAATAAQREPLPCGHPAACLEGGSSDPDAQVTMWCGACVELDQAREEAAKVEREAIVALLLRWDFGFLAQQIEAGAHLTEADDDPR